MKVIILFVTIFILQTVIFAQSKIKVEYIYESTNSEKEILISKTIYTEDGKKINTIDYYDGWAFSNTTYKYSENNLLIKSTTLWYESQEAREEEMLKYTTTYFYDKNRKLLGFKYEGDYSTDVSPNVFEYVYEKEDKPIKRLEFFENDEIKKILLFTITFKYDEKGNKIEEKRVAMDFDYEEMETFEYDSDNKLIKSVLYYNGDNRVYNYKYDYY